MRLEELVLRTPGDEFRVRFHEQLTVLSGIGMLERQALADSLLGALTGNADNTVLTFFDRDGREIEIVATGGIAACRHLDDGSPALPLVGTIAPTADALRALVLLQAGDLGLTPSRINIDEHPELAEARQTLTELTNELQSALANRQQHEKLRDELASVRSLVRQAEDGTARREYAQILAELERVRAESAALQSGVTGAETDHHLLESAEEARDLAARWTEAAKELSELSAQFVDERLDPATVDASRWYPETPPADLPMLLADLERGADEPQPARYAAARPGHSTASGTVEPTGRATGDDRSGRVVAHVRSRGGDGRSTAARTGCHGWRGLRRSGDRRHRADRGHALRRRGGRGGRRSPAGSCCRVCGGRGRVQHPARSVGADRQRVVARRVRSRDRPSPSAGRCGTSPPRARRRPPPSPQSVRPPTSRSTSAGSRRR